MRQWHSQKGKKDLQNLYIESLRWIQSHHYRYIEKNFKKEKKKERKTVEEWRELIWKSLSWLFSLASFCGEEGAWVMQVTECWWRWWAPMHPQWGSVLGHCCCAGQERPIKMTCFPGSPCWGSNVLPDLIISSPADRGGFRGALPSRLPSSFQGLSNSLDIFWGSPAHWMNKLKQITHWPQSIYKLW